MFSSLVCMVIGWLMCCVFWWLCFFFFFKQKTAYEMRISDWSSDVCSSDLFQGTDPREFDQARQWFDGQVRQSGGRLHDLDLAQSFRSTGAVLDVVNRLIADLGPEAFGLDRGIPLHQTSRMGEAGQVILLPPTREALPEERSEEHTSELQSLMRNSYAVF